MYHCINRCDERSRDDNILPAVIMNIIEENKRMNYYVPVQKDSDQPSQKKEFCNNSSALQPHRAARILGRRYALTRTSYKFLDIAISVGSEACVELVLSDNRGNEMILPIEIWKGIMRKREDIEQALQFPSIASPIWIRDLQIAFVEIPGTGYLVKFTLFKKSLFLKLPTMRFLLDLEDCINHMYSWLCENTHLVTMKFNRFVNVIQHALCTNASVAVKTIRESKEFDSESLIDCELLAYALDNILYEVANK